MDRQHVGEVELRGLWPSGLRSVLGVRSWLVGPRGGLLYLFLVDANVKSEELSDKKLLYILLIIDQLLRLELQPTLQLHQSRVELPLII